MPTSTLDIAANGNIMAVPNLQQYIYRPLESPNHIRYISLAPRSQSEELQRTLLHAHLDERPPYTALSEVCGDTYGQEEIFCDGSPLPITYNLKQALLQFRDESLEKRIWADSIAINQADPEERSLYVQLIGRIYQQVTSVMIWLGDEDETTSLAYSCLNRIYGRVNCSTLLGSPGDQEDTHELTDIRIP